MSLGKNIRDARKALDMTLKDLKEKAKKVSPEKIRVSVSHLSQIERDIKPPSLKVLSAIALAMGTTVAQLSTDKTSGEIAFDETAQKAVAQIVEAAKKGRVQDWVERIANIARRANLPLAEICWQGSPHAVAINIVSYAIENHNLKQVLDIL